MEYLIAAIADLHGEYPAIPESDILLIAGDINSGGIDSEEKQKNKINDLQSWLENIPVKIIIASPGNHDIYLSKEGKKLNLPWIYLEDEGIELEGISIYGMPWVPPIYGVFNAKESEIATKSSLIPENTDIVIAHGPPYGCNDLVGGEHVGSTAFRKNIQTSNYGLVVSGHIHECFGRAKLRNKYGKDTIIANVSYADNLNPAQQFKFDTNTGIVQPLPWR